MLAKFPDAAVEEWAPVLFLPLVTRLVNDPVAGVRTAVGHTLRALLQVGADRACCLGGLWVC